MGSMNAAAGSGRTTTMKRDMIERSAVIVRNPRVEYRKLVDRGGAVLLNLETAAYHGLNETGSLIWETVGSGMTIDELVPRVAVHFEEAPPSLHTEIDAFVEDLVRRDLLRITESVTTLEETAGRPVEQDGGG
jgi:hypothetical protein